MEDEILDYNWVMTREIPLKENEGTLFQQYFNEGSLILAAAMLHDNNIIYHVKIDNPENDRFKNLIHEIHINENELERANKLLELLVNEDVKYPIRKYLNSPLSSLEILLKENKNVYTETLVKIELKRRGIELVPVSPTGTANDLVPIIMVLTFLFFIFLVYQMIKEIWF